MNYNHYKVEIDGRDCTAQVPFPIKFSQLLDEQLDEASISIIRTKRKIIPPLTSVKITLWNDGDIGNGILLSMIVASDKATELPVGSGFYNHDLYLIEETKILEGFIVRSHGYVNSLLSVPDFTPKTVTPTLSNIKPGGLFGKDKCPDGVATPLISSPVLVGEKQSYPSAGSLYGAYITYAQGNYEVTSIYGPLESENPRTYKFDAESGFDFTFEEVGSYIINYNWGRGMAPSEQPGDAGSWCQFTYSYSIDVISFREDTPPSWNGLKVLRRALDIAEPIIKGDRPRFLIDGDNIIHDSFLGAFGKFNELPQNARQGNTAWIGTSPQDGYAVKYYDPYNTGLDNWLPTYETFEATTGLSGTAAKLLFIKTPEFQFTQSTLREILQGIGSFIHAEPRLKNGVIFYDFYGSGEQSEKVFKRYGAQQLQLNIERFATGIDSSVDNLTNSLGYAQGVVVEPFGEGFRNVLTESLYTRVDENNCFIKTKYPIRKILKLECWYENDDGTITAGSAEDPLDITGFVYESSDYSQLSSYVDNKPYAKCYALYFTSGNPNVYGLNFKDQGAIIDVFNRYAIVNIVRLKIGSDTWHADISRFKFRITYESISSARVKQSKGVVVETSLPREISYTQGQNMIESQYYGEHLKGVVARIGNVDKVLTVVEPGFVLPPKIGTIYEMDKGDYYVSASAVEVNTTTTKITLTLSKDFNKYSDYISINSVKRQFEISEKQAYDSSFVYRDYCVIGDYKDYSEKGLLFNIGTSTCSLSVIIPKIFTQKSDGVAYRDKKVTIAILKGEGDAGKYKSIGLPVIAFSLGNSAVFTCKYEDNYSAGTQIQKDSSIYFTNGVSYSSQYGEMKYLNIAYLGEIDWSILEAGSDIGIPSHEDIELLKKLYIKELSLMLPNIGATPVSSALVGTVAPFGYFNDKPILISKGSTEVPTINYQIDFVANRNSIVIGSTLAKNLPMVSGLQPEHYATLYVLQNRINKFEPIVDLSSGSAMRLRDYSNGSGLVINNYKTISFNNWSSSIDGKAWALVDNATGELLIGENKEIKAGENVFGANGLHISFTHDIYKKGE